jgi:hypothetical protein
MSAFGQGNNVEYLVHVIAVKHLFEEKGTDQDVRKVFQVVVKVRKELEPLLEAQEGETDFKKEEQRKKLTKIKKNLKTLCKLTVTEALKAYKLFVILLLARRKGNRTRLCTRCTPRTPVLA